MGHRQALVQGQQRLQAVARGVDETATPVEDEQADLPVGAVGLLQGLHGFSHPFPAAVHAQHALGEIAHANGRREVHEPARRAVGRRRQHVGHRRRGCAHIAHMDALQARLEPGPVADIVAHQHLVGRAAHRALGVGHADPEVGGRQRTGAVEQGAHARGLQPLDPELRRGSEHFHGMGAAEQAIGQLPGGVGGHGMQRGADLALHAPAQQLAECQRHQHRHAHQQRAEDQGQLRAQAQALPAAGRGAGSRGGGIRGGKLVQRRNPLSAVLECSPAHGQAGGCKIPATPAAAFEQHG